MVGFHLANALIMAYFVCSTQSLRMGMGQGWTPTGWLGRMVLALLLYSALHHGADEAWRDVLYRFALGGLGVYTASWAWRLSRRLHSFSAAVIAVAHLAAGLSLMAHGVWTATQIMPTGALHTWDVGMMSLWILLMTVVTHVCYVGMVMDKAASDKLQALHARQTAMQTQMLDAQLTRLDRRGRMAIVSGSLAHELNQPLTAATINAQMAERQGSGTPVAHPVLLTLLDQIEAGVNRTVRILQRIRSENGLLSEHHERVDLQAVLEAAVQQMAPECQRLAVTLTRERSPQALWCLGDELGLSQVVTNLLRNALDAVTGKPERHLWVRCGVDKDQAKLVVRDSGPGMSADQLAHWGMPFQSLRAEGMGLGLAISLEIVSRHRGQLQLSNRPEGGLEAVVSLPLAQDNP